MSQHYSDPRRETEPYTLPDIETFHHNHEDAIFYPKDLRFCIPVDDSNVPECLGTGWYWWSCFPGCLPDGDATGPFATEQEALADARQWNDEEQSR